MMNSAARGASDARLGAGANRYAKGRGLRGRTLWVKF
jgi:hypothetical protein